MKKQIYIYLFDGYSDWEIGYLTPEIRKNDEFELIYFSKDGKNVISMGGLQVCVSKSLNDVNSDNLALLILPGGIMWDNDCDKETEDFIFRICSKGKPVAAICGAVNSLGRLGILDKVKHTANDLNYLKAIVPGYKGEALYQQTLAFGDQGIITASGIAPIEFAKEVFKMIGLKSDEDIENWYQLFKYGIWKG